MNKLQHSQSLLRSNIWSDEDEILRPEVKRYFKINGQLPLFGDSDWNLSAIVHVPNLKASQKIAKFSIFESEIARITAKELAMQRLNYPIGALRRGLRFISPTALRSMTLQVNVIYRYFNSHGFDRLHTVTQSDLNDFLRYLQAQGLSPSTVCCYVTRLAWLHESQNHLTHDFISVRPWGGKASTSIANSVKDRENRTRRLPEDVMAFLFQWAWMYVSCFGGDIMAAFDVYVKAVEIREEHPARQPLAISESKLRDWLECCRAQNLKLPGHNNAKGHVNIHRIAGIVGITNHSAYRLRTIIEQYAVLLGTDGGYFDTPVSIVEGSGIKWRDPFDERAIMAEIGYLTTAAYIVCAFLSGMRDSELQSVKRGSLETLQDVYGRVVRYTLRSTEYKGKKQNPVSRTWVIIEPVAKSIRLLEDLTAIMMKRSASRESDYLFQQANCVGANLGQTVNAAIAKFSSHAQTVLQPRLVEIDVPEIDLEANRVTSRMFRRTLAWFIANRPFGVVAGSIQYGHASEVSFEGYAGSSESGFRAEVEIEQTYARRRDIVEMYDAHLLGERTAGPMAGCLSGEFEYVAGELRDFPGKVVDEKRRMKMLEHLRVRLHPGLLVDCFFSAPDAECLKHLSVEDRVTPLGGICDPHCKNACWAKKHAPNWKRASDDVKELAKRNRISPLQRKILQKKQHEYDAILEAIEGGLSGCE